MGDAPKLQGPVAALFDEAPPQGFDDAAEDLFRPSTDPVIARLDILEQRINEICKYLCDNSGLAESAFYLIELPINGIHIFPQKGNKP